MNRAQQLLLDGVKAFKAKRFDEAETLLMTAFKAYSPTDLGRRTAAVTLGAIYRKLGRYEEAIPALEQALPLPAAFKELVTMYRGFAKETRKSGDVENSTEWYRRMYSLAKTQEGVRQVGDLNRAAGWIEQIRRQCGTLYPHEYDGQPIAGDMLLTAADHKALLQTPRRP